MIWFTAAVVVGIQNLGFKTSNTEREKDREIECFRIGRDEGFGQGSF